MTNYYHPREVSEIELMQLIIINNKQLIINNKQSSIYIQSHQDLIFFCFTCVYVSIDNILLSTAIITVLHFAKSEANENITSYTDILTNTRMFVASSSFSRVSCTASASSNTALAVSRSFTCAISTCYRTGCPV